MTDEKNLSYEEQFHGSDRKFCRTERKQAILRDRSKYKKSDLDQRKKHLPPPPEDGLKARVLAIHPEGVIVSYENNLYRCQLKGSLKKENNRIKNLVAVGDFVLFQATSDQDGLIHFVFPRTSILSRADNLHRHKEQLIAVNIDQVIITVSVESPPLKPFLIDRYIIAAEKGQMTPIIVVNKIDLLSTEQELFENCKKIYNQLNIPILGVSANSQEGLETLKNLMTGKTSVFSGQSGVGKSSLINILTGSCHKTGSIVSKTVKGSHTTTTTTLLPMDGNGFCIDTPGIKSFGIWDLDIYQLELYYAEISEASCKCKFSKCSHTTEPMCAVQEGIATGSISPLRFASYSALMETIKNKHRHR